MTGFGLASAGPAPQPQAADMAAQDIIFLVGGGLLSCLIGVTGLLGFMGWIPGLQNASVHHARLRNEQKSAV